MKIELRDDKVILDGYVNAVARDSKPILDENGEKFVEQIMPKTFQRALEKSDNIVCLLNHLNNHILGSTKQGNINLWEDNIGLRAVCEITDAGVIQKARDDKLSGWSFGFELLKNSEEEIKDGLKRRFIEDINLLEVSILDDNMLPAYVGTSIETRGENSKRIHYRSESFTAKIFNSTKSKPLEEVALDYSAYEKVLENL